MRPIWRRADVDPNRSYVLLLIESNTGEREFELREFPLQSEEVENGRCIYVTEVMPIDLVLWGNLFGIAETVRLSNGGGFGFDSKGQWYTQEEYEQLRAETLARLNPPRITRKIPGLSFVNRIIDKIANGGSLGM